MCTYTKTCSRLLFIFYRIFSPHAKKHFIFTWPLVATGDWILTSSELHQRAVNSQHRVKARLSSLITISELLSQKRQEILRQRGDKSWTRVRSGDSCQVNGPAQKYEFLLQAKSQSVYFVYSVSLGILSLGLTNLHILTFTVLGMAVRVKFYCVLICQVSRNLRILFLRQIRNLLSSVSQGQVRLGLNAAVTSFILFLQQSLGASF